MKWSVFSKSPDICRSESEHDCSVSNHVHTTDTGNFNCVGFGLVKARPFICRHQTLRGVRHLSMNTTEMTLLHSNGQQKSWKVRMTRRWRDSHLK